MTEQWNMDVLVQRGMWTNSLKVYSMYRRARGEEEHNCVGGFNRRLAHAATLDVSSGLVTELLDGICPEIGLHVAIEMRQWLDRGGEEGKVACVEGREHDERTSRPFLERLLHPALPYTVQGWPVTAWSVMLLPRKPWAWSGRGLPGCPNEEADGEQLSDIHVLNSGLPPGSDRCLAHARSTALLKRRRDGHRLKRTT